MRKAINFLHHAEGKLLGVVENMSGLVCPHCHTEIDLFKKGGGKELAARYGVPFLGEIPLDPVTVVSADRGGAGGLPGSGERRQGSLPESGRCRRRRGGSRQGGHPARRVACRAGGAAAPPGAAPYFRFYLCGKYVKSE